MKEKVTIKIKRQNEFSDKLEVDGNKYLVHTEKQDKIFKIITKTYLSGAIINSITTDYSHLAGTEDLEKKVQEMIKSQHESILASFSKEQEAKAEKVKSKAEFAEEMRRALKKGDKKAALDAVRSALVSYPADPFFLSYYGFFVAAVEKRAKEGCTICSDAINGLRRSISAEKDFFYPILYLNLGKAYMIGRKKKEALNAFRYGLKYDNDNKDILSELRAIGFRKPPVISFLDRGHPINKYFGKLRHRLQSK